MADWSGFTEEDLLCVRQDNVLQRGRSAKRLVKTSTKSPTNCTIKVKDERTYEVLELEGETMGPTETTPTNDPNLNSNELEKPDDTKQAQDNSSPERKALSLEDFHHFHQRQRIFEEQNRKRKAMLAQAIAERQKKTNLENKKLMHIQNELQKLDSLVSNDVSILRDRIEIASLEFSDAQKRYEKCEEEFVRAKMTLFQKMEQKEQLTQHLYTIIENNELRKANKLAELMVELQMEICLDDLEKQSPSDVILPNLCIQNDNLCNRSSTLKNSECTPPNSDTVSVNSTSCKTIQTSDCQENPDATLEKNSPKTAVCTTVNYNDKNCVQKSTDIEQAV